MTDKHVEYEEADLFYADGHLADHAFQLLLNGKLDPLGSLEVSEHLSFCDKCVSRYADLLCGEVQDSPLGVAPGGGILLSPPESFLPSIMNQIHRWAVKVFFNRFATMAVAASFALVFWVGGSFATDSGQNCRALMEDVRTSSQRISQETKKITDNLQNFIEGVGGSFSAIGKIPF